MSSSGTFRSNTFSKEEFNSMKQDYNVINKQKRHRGEDNSYKFQNSNEYKPNFKEFKGSNYQNKSYGKPSYGSEKYNSYSNKGFYQRHQNRSNSKERKEYSSENNRKPRNFGDERYEKRNNSSNSRDYSQDRSERKVHEYSRENSIERNRIFNSNPNHSEKSEYSKFESKKEKEHSKEGTRSPSIQYKSNESKNYKPYSENSSNSNFHNKNYKNNNDFQHNENSNKYEVNMKRSYGQNVAPVREFQGKYSRKERYEEEEGNENGNGNGNTRQNNYSYEFSTNNSNNFSTNKLTNNNINNNSISYDNGQANQQQDYIQNQQNKSQNININRPNIQYHVNSHENVPEKNEVPIISSNLFKNYNNQMPSGNFSQNFIDTNNNNSKNITNGSAYNNRMNMNMFQEYRTPQHNDNRNQFEKPNSNEQSNLDNQADINKKYQQNLRQGYINSYDMKNQQNNQIHFNQYPYINQNMINHYQQNSLSNNFKNINTLSGGLNQQQPPQQQIIPSKIPNQQQIPTYMNFNQNQNQNPNLPKNPFSFQPPHNENFMSNFFMPSFNGFAQNVYQAGNVENVLSDANSKLNNQIQANQKINNIIGNEYSKIFQTNANLNNQFQPQHQQEVQLNFANVNTMNEQRQNLENQEAKIETNILSVAVVTKNNDNRKNLSKLLREALNDNVLIRERNKLSELFSGSIQDTSISEMFTYPKTIFIEQKQIDLKEQERDPKQIKADIQYMKRKRELEQTERRKLKDSISKLNDEISKYKSKCEVLNKLLEATFSE
jgi:hypothetical protein